MRLARPAALFAAAAFAAGTLLSASAPASAGGPTSVLLVSPSTGRTEALHASNAAYTTLMSQLVVEPVPAEGPGFEPGIGGDQVVVTWMVHDIQPWRVDRITFDDEGRPEWINTVQSMGAQLQFEDQGVWHRPTDVGVLHDLLADLGLVGRTGLQPVEESADAEAESADAAAPAAAPPGDGGAAGAALWALPALAAGGAAGVLGDRWLRRRRDGRDGGRWQLVDVPGSTT
ncbi:hypothetical protein E1212_02425 [Jiangella ureilytica]|uniref:Uncharacterized protein n=1 Tax=Jiangella ureilytica TaxID=2530374 RepID=A0A4R4RWP0_9ACTN|nr:hypothetical protein [Jiangella ureilytica]TDC54618.1 hypothetical protein E1212_02425 [Jiangella ureilytica]